VLGLVTFAGFTMLDFQRIRRSCDTGSAPLLAASVFLDILNVLLFFLQILSRKQRATPGHGAHKARPMEYLVTMTTHVPEEPPGQTAAGVRAHQAAHSSELAGQGHLPRPWRLPLRPANHTRWVVATPRNLAETQAILKPMPLDAWMAVQTAPLTSYPIDRPRLAAS
jgi:muconolactone delta-isomerase